MPHRPAARPIYAALLIGGESMNKQFDQLRRGPRIIVGTPGRINDHLERRSLNLSGADFLVLDEADKMLDMGFHEDILKIIRFLPAKRQNLLFSATFPSAIAAMSQAYQRNALRVTITDPVDTSVEIEQWQLAVEESEKAAPISNAAS